MFVQIAEAADLAQALTWRVIEKAGAAASVLPDISISINLPPVSLTDVTFPDRVMAHLATSGLTAVTPALRDHGDLRCTRGGVGARHPDAPAAEGLLARDRRFRAGLFVAGPAAAAALLGVEDRSLLRLAPGPRRRLAIHRRALHHAGARPRADRRGGGRRDLGRLRRAEADRVRRRPGLLHHDDPRLSTSWPTGCAPERHCHENEIGRCFCTICENTSRSHSHRTSHLSSPSLSPNRVAIVPASSPRASRR